MPNQPTPHDSVFRRIFGVPENAASQLRAVLPPDLAARLDLGRLATVPASFVDEARSSRSQPVDRIRAAAGPDRRRTRRPAGPRRR